MRSYLLCFFALFLIGGCSSRIPEPIAYPYSQQQKMQASYHWQVLAGDLANRINNELITTDNMSKNVSVKETCGNEATPCDPTEISTFSEAFRDLLITDLVALGIPTKQQKDEETLEILYKVQIVRHNTDRSRSLQPGVLTALSAAIVVLRDAPSNLVTLAIGAASDVANANMTISGHYEIIITTSMVASGKYLFRASDIYYINDKDFWHYQDHPPRAKAIKLTGPEQPLAKDSGKVTKESAKPAPETTVIEPFPIPEKEI